MKRKFLGLAICLTFAFSSLLTAIGMSLSAKAENAPDTGGVNTWALASNNNCTIQDDNGAARIKETKHSSDRSSIDVITNTEGYDVTKAIEFDMYLHNLPFDGSNAANPASTDYWIGLFLTSAYTDQFYTVQDPNGTLNFNMRGLKNENGAALTGRYALPDGRRGDWNDERHYSGADNKITLRFEICEEYTVVYQKTEQTQDLYEEWLFIPEIGRDFFKTGKAYFNMRFHVASNSVNPDLMDLGLSRVRNTEALITDGDVRYVVSENLVVSKDEDKDVVAVNAVSGYLYYRMPVTMTKKVEVKFTLDHIPGYHTDEVDSWLGIFLGKSVGNHSPWSNDAYGMMVRPENATQISGDSVALVPTGQNVTASLREGPNSMVFEMQKSRLKLSLNGESVSLKLDASYFVGNNAYLGFFVNNPSYTGEENKFAFSYQIVNDEEIILPQIRLSDTREVFETRQDEDLVISYEGDSFVSLSGNNVSQGDYVVNETKKTVTVKKEYLRFLPTDETLEFGFNGEQSACTLKVLIKPTAGIVQIVTPGRNFVYDKVSAEGLAVEVSGDRFVSLSGNGIAAEDYIFETTGENKGTLTLNKSYFSKLRRGEYTFSISGENSSIDISVSLKGQPPQPLQIRLVSDKETFDGDEAKDVEICSVEGVPVNIVGNVIMSRDYKLENGKIILTKEYLATLKNGAYTYRVYEEEGSFVVYTLTVINSKAEVKAPEDSTDSSGSAGCGSSVAGTAGTAFAALTLGAALLLKRCKKSNKENR